MQQRPLFDLLAPLYARVVPTFFSRLTTRASQRIRAGAPASIVEIGVGQGDFLAEVAGRRASSVVGVDVSRKMLGRARKSVASNEGRADLVQADGSRLPFGDGRFEGVVSLLLLSMLSDDEVPVALREMTRVLAPGGRIIVGSVAFKNNVLAKMWKTAYRMIPGLVGGMHPVEIDPHLDALGLRVLKEEEIDERAGARLLTLVKVIG